MFSHSITVYNAKYNSEIRKKEYFRTILKGVHYEDQRAVNRLKGGAMTNDHVRIAIPFNCEVEAGKIFVEPKNYNDPSTEFTLTAEDKIVKGEVYDEIKTGVDIEKKYDYVSDIISVDVVDYGSKRLQYFEVACK